MTTFERFERSIPELMTELAPTRVPDYVDDMLQQTEGATQRPAWSFPERWLPVEITARPLAMRSFPWRPVLVLALVALLVAATVAVYVGSQNRVPPPFGVAGNGVLMYRGADGAIVSIDPASDSRATVVPASDHVGDPVVSRDGRRIALASFESSTEAQIIVAGIDGSNRNALAGTYRDIGDVDWSPDDTRLAIVSDVGGLRSITVADADGSAAISLPLGRDVFQVSYLPDGRIAAMAAERPGDVCPAEDPTEVGCALVVMNADGTGVDTLVKAADFHGINQISPSPDGKTIVYVEWSQPALPGRLRIFDLASHSGPLFALDSFPWDFNINRAWFSPDGKSILFDLFETDGDHWAVIPTAGGPIVRLGQKWPQNGTDAAWAPDGKSVLVRYPTSDTTSALWLLDPTGSGADRQLQADVPYLPEWQRVAP
jgi:WD40 repeat protein